MKKYIVIASVFVSLFLCACNDRSLMVMEVLTLWLGYAVFPMQWEEIMKIRRILKPLLYRY